MFRTYDTGNSGVLLLFLLLGIIVVGGVMLVFSGSEDPKDAQPSETRMDFQDAAIIDTIADAGPDPLKEISEGEEEKPIQYKTVDAQGHFMYIQSEPVKVYMPGKGVKKARMIMKDTGQRALPVPEAVKKNAISKKTRPHPSMTRKKGGKVKASDPDKIKTEGPDQGSKGTVDGPKKVDGGS